MKTTMKMIEDTIPLVLRLPNGDYVKNGDVRMYIPYGELWKHYVSQLSVWRNILEWIAKGFK